MKTLLTAALLFASVSSQAAIGTYVKLTDEVNKVTEYSATYNSLERCKEIIEAFGRAFRVASKPGAEYYAACVDLKTKTFLYEARGEK